MSEEEAIVLIEETITAITEQLQIALQDQICSLLLMGSSARGKVSPELQDLDFVLVVRDEASVQNLRAIRETLNHICDRHSGGEISVFWIALDGPWEPTPRARYNIGIHMAVLGLSQLRRRALHQNHLALTMYPNCRLLAGNHPLEFVTIKPIVPSDILYNWTSVVWLKSLALTAYGLFLMGQIPAIPLMNILRYVNSNALSNLRLADFTIDQKLADKISVLDNQFRRQLDMQDIETSLGLVIAELHQIIQVAQRRATKDSSER